MITLSIEKIVVYMYNYILKNNTFTGGINLKKIFAIVLTVIIAVSGCSISAFAGIIDEKSEISEYPVIIVAGYSSSELVLVNDDGTEEKVWHPDMNNVLKLVLQNIAKIGIGLGDAVWGEPEYLASLVGEKVVDMLGVVALNDDGTSKYNVRPMYTSAAESNSQVMYDEYGDDTNQFETDITASLREYIPRENIYNFYVDWRMGAVSCAKALDKYIQEVKEYSNCEKVNLVAISHGGQVTGTYLTLFGYKCDVDNAVMNVPALAGAGIVYDMLSQNVKFDELNLLYFIEHGMRWENDYHWLVEAQQLGFLDDVINALIPYFYEVIGNFGSIWDFCPTEIYEEMKAKWLDEDKNANLIAESDYMHYEVMPKFYTSFQECIDKYGMNVSIIAGTDSGITTGADMNSDGIISTESSTGAKTAKIGERFADGYVQENEYKDYMISPAMTVDASTAYLKDNTWFISGMFHGMMYWDNFTRELLIKLALTDEITSVYSSPDYPRFHTSSNPSYAIGASFNNSTEGYVSNEDSSIVLTNLSWSDYKLVISAINCDGASLKFDLKPLTVIKAGESVEIPFTGTLPKGNSRVAITVTYCDIGSLTPIGERTIYFTALSNEKLPETKDIVTADVINPIDNIMPQFAISAMKDTGMYNWCSMWYNFSGINSVIK